MTIEFDPAKSKWNAAERGLPFTMVVDFDWLSAQILEDTRKEYPERRFVATGLIAGRVHVLCFTPTARGIRVISFRKANDREVKRYEQKTTD